MARGARRAGMAGCWGMLLGLLAFFAAGGAWAQDALVVDSDKASVQATYASGQPVDFKLKSEPGEKIWLLLQAEATGATRLARPSDAYAQANGGFLFPFSFEDGSLADNADELFYVESASSAPISLVGQDLTGLGRATVSVMKGEPSSTFGLDPVQTVTLVEGPPLDEEVASGLQEALDSTVALYRRAGGALAVRFPDGRVWAGASGVADLETGEPVEVDDRFRIGSITKTFTGTVVLQLAQEGVLSLDDTVGKWLPGRLDHGDRITIRQLMYHTGGIDNYWHLGNDLYMEFLEDRTTELTHNQVLEETNKMGLVAEPGTEFYYSNGGPVIEAMIVEAATGEAMETQVTNRIFKVLDMSRSVFPSAETMPAPHVQGYFDFDQSGVLMDNATEDITFVNPSCGWASGAVVTSVTDLLTWGKALVDGDLLDEEYQRERLTMVDAAPGFKSGLHIFDDHGFLGHKGDFFGFQATVQRYEGYTFAAIVNTQYVEGVDPPDPQGNVAHLTFIAALPVLGLEVPQGAVLETASRRREAAFPADPKWLAGGLNEYVF